MSTSSSTNNYTFVLLLVLRLLQSTDNNDPRYSLADSNLSLSIEADLLEGMDLHSEVIDSLIE